MNIKANKENIISEILCLLCTHTTYLETFAQISAKVPMCRRTFDKYWNEANLRYRESQQNIQKELGVKCKSQAKQLAKKALMTREDLLRRLQDIVMNGKRDSDKINAIKVIVEMEGFKAPVKKDISIHRPMPIFGFNPLIDGTLDS